MSLLASCGTIKLMLRLLFILLFLGAISIFVFKPATQVPKIIQQVTAKTYTDETLSFQFEYPSSGYEVVSETEDSFFKAEKADHRKNFTGYVGYKPPEFVTGIALKKASATPLTLWVFDNPNNISIESWFDKYWYYPFVWGIFNYPDKNPLKPTIEATISGQLAKSIVVSYQPGKPEFIYVAKGDKMFMFKVIEGTDEKVIAQVLSSFKFTQ